MRISENYSENRIVIVARISKDYSENSENYSENSDHCRE